MATVHDLANIVVNNYLIDKLNDESLHKQIRAGYVDWIGRTGHRVPQLEIDNYWVATSEDYCRYHLKE